MKTLLINVALRPESKVKLFPIGLSYIATAIHNAGFDFDLVDVDAYRYSDEEVDSLIAKKTMMLLLWDVLLPDIRKLKAFVAEYEIFTKMQR